MKQAARKRGSLLEAARRGDEQAIETLTVEDIDLYSMVTKRIIKEGYVLHYRDLLHAKRYRM